MQIDFGGFGKEYAVDQAVQIARNICSRGSLVNFGGDLAISRPRPMVGHGELASRILDRNPVGHLVARAATRSAGNERRYLRFVLANGARYTHVLDPRSGWPVTDAPRSVTVAAGTCTQAGMLTTLALLEGSNAERFLAAERVPHWVRRH